MTARGEILMALDTLAQATRQNRTFGCRSSPGSRHYVCPDGRGRLFLASALDLGSRRLLGYSTADHMRVLDALAMAIAARGCDHAAAGVLAHTDRGSQSSAAGPRQVRRKATLWHDSSPGQACNRSWSLSWSRPAGETVEQHCLAHATQPVIRKLSSGRPTRSRWTRIRNASHRGVA